MISRAENIYEYDQVDIARFQEVFEPNEEAIRYEMNRLINKYITWAEGEEVRSLDMAVCALESSVARFQKEKIKLVVGSGMFHKELEDSIVGMKKGESKRISLGEGIVEVTVISVTNRIAPEITDEMVETLQIEGVKTVKDYRDHLVGEQKKELASDKSYDAIQYVMEEVARKSDLILKHEDWTHMAELELGRYRALASQEGLKIEEMTEKEFDGKIPVTSYHELVALVQHNAWNTLTQYVLGIHYAKLDQYEPDEQEYDEFIKEYMEIWHTTEEDAKASNTYQHFVVNCYTGHYYNKVRNYVEEHLLLEA